MPKITIWVDEWTMRRLHALAGLSPEGDTEAGVLRVACDRLESGLTHGNDPDEMRALIECLAPPEGTEVN